MGTDLEALSNSPQPMAQIFNNSFGSKGTLGLWAFVVIVQCGFFFLKRAFGKTSDITDRYMMGSSMVGSVRFFSGVRFIFQLSSLLLAVKPTRSAVIMVSSSLIVVSAYKDISKLCRSRLGCIG